MHTEAFDFTTLPDRNNIGCAKWNRRTEDEMDAGIVPMTIADMEFRCAPCIVDAVKKAAEHGVYGYTDPDDAYYAAVSHWMEKRHGWKIQPEWILPQNGVVPALCVAVRAFTEPGDSVLVQSPGYFPFRMAVEENGRTLVESVLTMDGTGYHMDLEDLRRKAADPRAKLLLLCSPHNPVGRIWSPDTLRAVADICRENDVIVISDEIHFDLELYGKHTVFCQAAPEMEDRCVILTSTSKTFNVAGMQLANTIIPGDALRARFEQRMLADGTSNISYFGYHVTLAAYTQGEPWLDALLETIRGNFAYLGGWLQEYLPAVRLLPVQGTYLAWTDWRALGLDGGELDKLLRGDAMLLLNNGRFFGQGGEGFMRWNLALPKQELEKALNRLLIVIKNQKII